MSSQCIPSKRKHCNVLRYEDIDPFFAKYKCINKVCNCSSRTFFYCKLCDSYSTDRRFKTRHLEAKSHLSRFRQRMANHVSNQNDDKLLDQSSGALDYVMDDGSNTDRENNYSIFETVDMYLSNRRQSRFISDDSDNIRQMFSDCVSGSISEPIHKEFFESIMKGKRCPVSDFVARSFSVACQVGRSNSNSVGCLSNEESLFHLMLSHLCTGLTERQIDIMLALMNYMTGTGVSTSRIPGDGNPLNQYWIDGKNSIQSNLPTPTPEFIEETKCCYTSLEQVIRYNSVTGRYPRPFGTFKDSAHGMCARAQEWFQVADSILDPPEPNRSTLLRVKVIFWSDSATLFGLKDLSFHLCVASVGAPDGNHSGKWGFPL